MPVYIVDDDRSVRDSLRYVLEGYGFRVRDFDSGEHFLKVVTLDTPGCVILDRRMPGLSGPEVHARLDAAGSCLEVIFLTSHGDLPMAVKAFRDGACDFHQKPVNAAELVPSIKRAQERSQALCKRHRLQLRFDKLTRREKQIFDFVSRGYMNKQIASELSIAVRTVEVHRAKMMERLEANSIADLVKIADALQLR